MQIYKVQILNHRVKTATINNKDKSISGEFPASVDVFDLMRNNTKKYFYGELVKTRLT